MRITLHTARSFLRKKFKRPADNLLISASGEMMGRRGDPNGWKQRVFEITTDLEIARTGIAYGQIKMHLIQMEQVPNKMFEPGAPDSLQFRPVSTTVYLATEKGWLETVFSPHD